MLERIPWQYGTLPTGDPSDAEAPILHALSPNLSFGMAERIAPGSKIVQSGSNGRSEMETGK